MNEQEVILRENIRQAIRLVKKKKMLDSQKQLNEETQLRNLVKQFLDIEIFEQDNLLLLKFFF